MENRQHSVSCAALRTSVEVLSSGLEAVIASVLEGSNGRDSDAIFHCCYVGVISAWEDTIKRSFERLISRSVTVDSEICCTDQVFGSAFGSIKGMSSKTSLSNTAKIGEGDKGRMISSLDENGIHKGSIILSESPYLITSVAPCRCHEGPILVEHLIMAWALAKFNRVESNRREEEFSVFMETVQSSLSESVILTDDSNRHTESDHVDDGHNVCETRNKADLHDSTDKTDRSTCSDGDHSCGARWSLHVQCVMACTAVIACISDSLSHSDSTTSPSTQSKEKENEKDLVDMSQDSFKSAHDNTNTLFRLSFLSRQCETFKYSYNFFQTLARLPHNTHAISSVKVNTSAKGNKEGVNEVEQCREGFGLFLYGSAVNHSCDPNSCVRYQYPDAHRNEYDDDRSDFGSGGNIGNGVGHNDTFGAGVHDLNHLDSRNDSDSNSDSACNNRKISDISNNTHKKTQAHNKIHRRETLRRLANVRLEVVSTRSIPKGTECCISYGPLKGQHAKESRVRFLEKQYLFVCHCDACESEGEISGMGKGRETGGDTGRKTGTGTGTGTGVRVSDNENGDVIKEGMEGRSGTGEGRHRYVESENLTMSNIVSSCHDIMCPGKAQSQSEEVEHQFKGKQQHDVCTTWKLDIIAKDDEEIESSRDVNCIRNNSDGTNHKKIESASLFLSKLINILNILNTKIKSLRNDMDDSNLKFEKLKTNSQDSPDKRIALQKFENEICLPRRKILRKLYIDYFEKRKWQQIMDYNSEDCIPNSCDKVGIGDDDDVKKILRSKKVFRRMYTEYCSIFCLASDMSAQILSMCGEYRGASLLMRDVISGMTSSRSLRRYADDDVAVARERVKLVQCLWLSGDTEECSMELLLAERDLEPFLSEQDPDRIEIQKIKNLLSAARKKTKSKS